MRVPERGAGAICHVSGLLHGCQVPRSNAYQVSCAQLSQALQQMKATPEGDGSLLDNSLVVFLNECALVSPVVSTT
jgi:hypothetical protein